MRINRIKKEIFSIILMILLLPFQACNSDQDYIPYVPVKFTIELSVYNQLMNSGYSMLFEDEGYGGVIVFCEYYDVATPTASLYYAYDATCTFEVSEDCTLENEGNSVNAVCSCCGSEYSLFGGYPFKGDASRGLKSYNVSVLGNRLYISN